MSERDPGHAGPHTVELKAHDRAARLTFDEPTDHIARIVIDNGDFYERDLLDDAYGRLEERSGWAVDVGAHVGNHSIFFGAICGLRVLSVEPNPRCLGPLEANLADNGIQGKILAAAASSEPGTGILEELREGNSGMTRVVPGPGDVEFVTLDKRRPRGQVVVVKIDVEDGELEVLRGAAKLIERDRPRLYVEAATDERKAELDAFLEPLGYSCFGRFCKTPTWGYAA